MPTLNQYILYSARIIAGMTSGYRGFDDPKKLHYCVEKLGMIISRDRLKKALGIAYQNLCLC